MSASRAAGLLLAVTLVQGCGDYDEPLPPVHGQHWDLNCTLPLPPPPPHPAGLELAVIARGRDPVHCLPAEIQRDGLVVDVELSSRGHPFSVAAALHMCLEIGPDGEPKPPYTLSPDAQECILDDLRTWRFASGSPCHAHGTSIRLTVDGAEPSAAAAFRASGGCGS